MTASDFHGRAADLSALHAIPNGVVCVVGDSGIGKSDLLAALAGGWGNDDLVAHASVLGALAGSLQEAIADAIGDCLAIHTSSDDGVLTRLRRGFESLLDRAIAVGSKEMTQLLITSALAAVESKLGKEGAASVRSGMKDLLFTAEEDLGVRLRQTATPDMATTLLAYISEVSEITARRLVLRFDAGELLSDYDVALLGELASRAIDAFVLVVTVNSQHPGISEKLAVLETRGLRRHDLAPLTTEEIETWLTHAQVPPELWGTFIRRSAGYPFFIHELITLYATGQIGGAVAVPEGFNSLLRGTWNNLDLQQQIIATSLASFPEPPSDVFIGKLTNKSAIEWSAIRRSLIASRVFVTRPDGTMWFHDRRRDFIWREILDAGDRAAVAEAALEVLQSTLSSSSLTSEWVLVGVPELLRVGSPTVSQDPYLSQIPELSKDELALMYALIELTESGDRRRRIVDTTSVGRLALSELGLPKDPIGGLDSLATRGFLVSQSNQHASLTFGVFPGLFAICALIAQIGAVLQRSPTPMLGSASFNQFIRPLIGDFEMASVSVGQGSLGTHCDSLRVLRREHQAQREIGRLPSLGVDYFIGSQPITATIVFESADVRDLAEAALGSYVADDRADAMRIGRTYLLPARRIRLARLVQILEESEEGGTPSTILERACQVTRIREAVRRLLDPEEASAINWTGPLSLLIDIAESGESWAEVRLRGGVSATVSEFTLYDRRALMSDPLMELKLRRDGHIDNEQVSEGWTIRSGTPVGELKTPLREVREELEKSAQSFNRGLARVEVPVDEFALQKLLSEERVSRRQSLDELIAARVQALVFNDETASLYVFVYPYVSEDGELGIESWMAFALVADDHQGETVVRVLSERQPHPSIELTVDECGRFGLPSPDTHKSSTDGVAEEVLGPLLGWDADDIRLTRAPAL